MNDIEWVFKSCEPSGPLRQLLESGTEKKSYHYNSVAIMNENEKEEKKQNFIEWVTFISDRVSQWKKSVQAIENDLSWNVESFIILERYILETYQKDTIVNPENKNAVDAIASYIGETLVLRIINDQSGSVLMRLYEGKKNV